MRILKKFLSKGAKSNVKHEKNEDDVRNISLKNVVLEFYKNVI